MKLNSLCLIFLLSLGLVSSNQAHGFDSATKNGVLIGCAALAGIGLGAIAYDYFFSLTDEQEFAQAIALCEKTEKSLENMQLTYADELALSGSHNLAKNVRYALRLEPVNFPLYHYTRSLESNINSLDYHEEKISEKKIHIFERRAKLLTALVKTSEQESISLKSSIEAYDHVLDALEDMQKNVKKINQFLHTLKVAISNSASYIIEAQQIRILELQGQLIANQFSSFHPKAIRPHEPHITNVVYVYNARPTVGDAPGF